MAEISWIKLSTGLPDNRKIKRIRKLPDGDNVILFWVFLMARAGESNKSGGLFLTETLPYSEDDLAADFDFTIEFVRFAILTLEKYGMITKYDDVIFIKNWEEYQAIEGMEKVREQNRIRQARHKEKQKRLSKSNVTDNVIGNAKVTLGNATDIDKELDIDKEYINHMSGKDEKIPYKEIIEYLNQKTSKKFKVIQKHKDFIKARWNEGQRLEDFKQVIDNMVANWTGKQFSGKPAENYLQPSTLFGNKFDQYLNQTPKPNVFDQESGYDDELGF